MTVNGNGLIAAYIHTGGKVGVLVEVGADKDATVSNEEFKQLVRDITLQIAAANPVAVSREQVPPALIEKEKEIAAQSARAPASHRARISSQRFTVISTAGTTWDGVILSKAGSPS